MIGAPLILTIGMLILRKSLIKLTKAPILADHREVLRKKVATIVVTKTLDVVICIKEPHHPTRGIGGCEGEAPMALPAVMYTTLILIGECNSYSDYTKSNFWKSSACHY